MKIACLALTVAAGLAASANATFFSFASDTADSQWTFRGIGNKVTQGDANGVNIDLVLNNDNGGIQQTIHTKFFADWTLAYDHSSGVGSMMTHQYRASGLFRWVNSDGAELLRCAFEDAVLTASGKSTAWASTATVMGTDDLSSVQYTSGIDNPALGLVPGMLAGPQDFAFTLTVISTNGAIPGVSSSRGVSIGHDMMPAVNWFSEGSYSGSAVPTPGSAALVGLGALAIGRRRRA